MKVKLPIIAAFICSILAASSVFAQDDITVIHAGKILDVRKGTYAENVLIIVKGDKIDRIAPISEKGKFGNVIDLSDHVLLPGLIDAHAHLTLNSYDSSVDPYELPAASYGIIGTVNAKKTLESGITTVRDIHSYFYSDIALRDAIAKGWIPGPRMYVSGPAITMTGGHGAWANWLSPQLELRPNPGSIADGPDEVRKAVREHIKLGVNVIKVMATGGFGTSGSIPGASSYTVDELKAVVDEAHKHGIRVAAHAHGAQGIKNAVIAGVDSIEHATFLDDESIELMKKHKVFLVMDLKGGYYDLIEKNNDYSDKSTGLSNQQMYREIEARFLLAYRSGVKMAFGTDSSVFPHERAVEQFRLMKKAGMAEADIVRSATLNAADLVGIANLAGSIEPGKWADIIAVKDDPLTDVSALERVVFVMKAGKIYRREGK